MNQGGYSKPPVTPTPNPYVNQNGYPNPPVPNPYINQGGYPNPNMPTMGRIPVDPGKGQGKTALTFGILALIFNFCCAMSCGALIPLILSIIGLNVSKSAMKKSASVGLINQDAKNGKTLSKLSIWLSIISMIIGIIVFSETGSPTAILNLLGIS